MPRTSCKHCHNPIFWIRDKDGVFYPFNDTTGKKPHACSYNYNPVFAHYIQDITEILKSQAILLTQINDHMRMIVGELALSNKEYIYNDHETLNVMPTNRETSSADPDEG